MYDGKISLHANHYQNEYGGGVAQRVYKLIHFTQKVAKHPTGKRIIMVVYYFVDALFYVELSGMCFYFCKFAVFSEWKRTLSNIYEQGLMAKHTL